MFISSLIKTIDELKVNYSHNQMRYRGIRTANKVFLFGIHSFIEGTTLRVFKILRHKQLYK